MSDFLNNIISIKTSKPYIDYKNYHQGNIFGITKTSRWELMHSNFIAWALSNDSPHALGFYPLYQLVKAVGIIQDNADNTSSQRLDTALLYRFFEDDFIVDAAIEREYPVKDSTSTKKIDLLIEITTRDKILPIIIENKVESSENGKNKDQTQVYYDWSENEAYPDRTIYYDPVYIYLYPEYKHNIQKCDKYIRMTYQELVNYILEPSMLKCGDIVSKNNYRQYLQALSFQSDSEKGGHTMAITTEEQKILDEFIDKNRDLLLQVLLACDDLPDSAKKAITTTLKDTSKYEFDSNTYGKGKLVLAVVHKYVKDNPTVTFADLKNSFPDKLQGAKGVVQLAASVSKADMGVGGKKRYFIKATEIISLSSGEKVLVSVDWGKGNIDKFIDHVTDNLKYSIIKK